VIRPRTDDVKKQITLSVTEPQNVCPVAWSLFQHNT